VTPFDTCSLCPRLCRDACPVATGASREAAVPAVIAGVLRDWRLGRASDELASEAATLCLDCGGCESACHLHRPLPQQLREVRRALVTAPRPAPLQPIEGEGDLVAVEADERPLAAVLAKRLGRPVRRWPTADRLGASSIEGPAFADHARRLREAAAGRKVVVADGGSARALAAAGIAASWAHEWVERRVEGCVGSCVAGGDRPLRCCGGAAPLAWRHPADARRVARTFAARMDGERVVDARCRDHLRSAGVEARDLLDDWLAEGP
jgi:hypothetical protein